MAKASKSRFGARMPVKGGPQKRTLLYIAIACFIIFAYYTHVTYVAHTNHVKHGQGHDPMFGGWSAFHGHPAPKHPESGEGEHHLRMRPMQRDWAAETPTPQHVKLYEYVIQGEYPHDTGAYLQGLQYHNGRLYESTGMYGETSVREVELRTGKVLKQTMTGKQHFGEGLTVMNNQIYQLTWRSPRGFKFNLETLKLEGSFETRHADNKPFKDGWGLTYDGTQFIATDSGTDLFFLDPATMKEVRRVTVTDDGTPIEMVNEIEFIDGVLYANIYQTECIARINPESGKVLGWIVLDDILNRVHKEHMVPNRRHDNVLNGIAYNPATKNLLVSGKRWPSVFEIKLVEKKHLLRPPQLKALRHKCVPKSNVFRI